VAEFSCIYTADDVIDVIAVVADLGMQFLWDKRYSGRFPSSAEANEIFGPAAFPRSAYAYLPSDALHVPMVKIESKDQSASDFYSIDDLSLPEHLRLSAVLRNEPSLAGVFIMSYHPQFLAADGQVLVSASPELKRAYLAAKRRAENRTVKVHAYKSDYLVFAGARRMLQADGGHTTYGGEFDIQVRLGLS